MERLRRWGGLAAVGVGALLLAACGNPRDYTEIVTFTDEHGRVCTAAVVVDQEQNEGDDHEVSSIDCDYPPEGREPGPDSYRRLPERPGE